MSAKHSIEVTDRIRSGDHLLSAFDVEGPRVAACFLDETRPHFEEGDEEPRLAGFLAAAGRKVRSSLDHLVETDFAVARAEGLESVLRHQFQDDKRELAFCIVAFRRLTMGQYVAPDLANLGLEPLNVRDGMTVQRRGELVGERFEALNLAKMLGKSRFDEPIDLRPHVAEIRKKAAALLALSHEINEAQRASDRARIARSRAKDAYDRVYLRAARIFEDTCRFCGLDDLADRIRRREARASTSGSRGPFMRRWCHPRSPGRLRRRRHRREIVKASVPDPQAASGGDDVDKRRSHPGEHACAWMTTLASGTASAMSMASIPDPRPPPAAMTSTRNRRSHPGEHACGVDDDTDLPLARFWRVVAHS